jgi:hypothetical protein
MRLEWEEELLPSGNPTTWQVEHHLKKKFTEDLVGRPRDFKITVAWVTKIGDRKWHCQFVNHNDESRTFRSLKAAKAYAVAIITLEN